MNLPDLIDRLYDLRPGTTPLERDHPRQRTQELLTDNRQPLTENSPLLLLAAFDLIDEGKECDGVTLRICRKVLTFFVLGENLFYIIPLSSFGERAQDRLVRGGPCLFLSIR